PAALLGRSGRGFLTCLFSGHYSSLVTACAEKRIHFLPDGSSWACFRGAVRVVRAASFRRAYSCAEIGTPGGGASTRWRGGNLGQRAFAGETYSGDNLATINRGERRSRHLMMTWPDCETRATNGPARELEHVADPRQCEQEHRRDFLCPGDCRPYARTLWHCW